MNQLPIHQVLPQLTAVLGERNAAVLIAEPGAGKTTQVPLAFLKAPWLQGRRIIMLEPRRLAARSAARYMASALGERVGETVGYRVRMDSRVSDRTVIEVVTEGILTRMLQEDPELSGTGMIIFDEYHERSLQADTGLAFALESQSVLRDDLRLLIMSATLEAEPVAKLLGGAPVIVSEGRSYPVATKYLHASRLEELHKGAARAIQLALSEQEGDILVFLPGAREIRRTANELQQANLGGDIVIRQLHGTLSPEMQDEAIRPDPAGSRKVVLSTSIAESSITIQGIKVVVDSGYARTEVFSPRTGLPQLITRRLSKASADQRRGRAGRISAGVCYRMWSEEEHRHLPEHTEPAIRESDLAPLALELAAWGTRDPLQLAWLDPPPKAAFAQGQELLRQLGALDESGQITDHGRSMARLGIHPRLAHMLLRGKELGEAALAVRLAVLLQERDIFRPQASAADQDIRSRLERLDQYERRGSGNAGPEGVDDAALKRMLQEITKLHSELGIPDAGVLRTDRCGLLLSFAYPDRIAKSRGTGSYVLRTGRGIRLASVQQLSRASYIVAAVIDDQGPDGLIQLAAPLEEEWLEEHFRDEMELIREVSWDPASGSVRARQRLMLGAVLIREQPYEGVTEEDRSAAVLNAIRREGLGLLTWTKAAVQLRERMAFMKRHDPAGAWPDVTDEALLANADTWLLPYLGGVRNRHDLSRLGLAGLLSHLLSWDMKQELEREAPTHIQVPSGSRIPVDYSDPDKPYLAVRLQELFGMKETPRIAGGRVALTLHLLSPAHRPVQVTSDLASFWSSGYFEVKKDLKGRYPKHYWPDDPLEATATNRTRPKPS
ncbi:ATP-dependent helicase HrpB [Paenibacillus sp. FSL W8-0919]|uniref:ATP-dependent helicase HrpB n=1 Tax=Paenibacillus TaxID=44249 RepID=UPI0030FBABAF